MTNLVALKACTPLIAKLDNLLDAFELAMYSPYCTKLTEQLQPNIEQNFIHANKELLEAVETPSVRDFLLDQGVNEAHYNRLKSHLDHDDNNKPNPQLAWAVYFIMQLLEKVNLLERPYFARPLRLSNMLVVSKSEPLPIIQSLELESLVGRYVDTNTPANEIEKLERFLMKPADFCMADFDTLPRFQESLKAFLYRHNENVYACVFPLHRHCRALLKGATDDQPVK